MGVMRCPAAGFFRALVLVAGVCSGQIPQQPANPPHYLEIKLPPGVISEVKALLYAPGCAIETLDLPVSGSSNQQYSFMCRSLSNIEILGALTRTDRLYGREVKLQATYVARWALLLSRTDPGSLS